MNHIELFAGCGGLCLGLTKAGFDLEFANELSPMASETFAYNILQENLLNQPQQAKKTLWLASNHDRESMVKRLREDPRSFQYGINCELDESGENLSGSLIIGNILHLNQWLKTHPQALDNIKNKNVDLVSGGPPCQSFSLAGLREKDNAKNSLPWAFATFANLVRPKIVMLENVTGILRPFTDKSTGKKYHAWFEVAKAFAGIGYIPLTLHINAKYAGIAQNRPRFILMGIREDIYPNLESTFNESEKELFSTPFAFFNKVKAGVEPVLSDLEVHDLNKEKTAIFDRFSQSFLAPLCIKRDNFFTVRDAIEDLSENAKSDKPSEYVQYINDTFKELLPHSQDLTGQQFISVTPRVQRRFRIYQVMSQLDDKILSKDISLVLSGKATATLAKSWDAIKAFDFLMEDGSIGRFESKLAFDQFLRNHQTKKQSQRALLPDQPSPATLSIPDDACHYENMRTLTAREMARTQSFPDDFVFRSKTTTGGMNRRFEVPIYTQIGNAVPVLLGLALGKSVKQLLDRLDSDKELLEQERKRLLYTMLEDTTSSFEIREKRLLQLLNIEKKLSN